jgi:hypothetical protein
MKSLLQNTNSGVFSDLLTKAEPVELLKPSLRALRGSRICLLSSDSIVVSLYSLPSCFVLRGLLYDLEHVHVYV